jgi:hypothetical protein
LLIDFISLNHYQMPRNRGIALQISALGLHSLRLFDQDFKRATTILNGKFHFRVFDVALVILAPKTVHTSATDFFGMIDHFNSSHFVCLHGSAAKHICHDETRCAARL